MGVKSIMYHFTDENEIAIFDIIGAAMEVHSELKSGLLEAVYAEAISHGYSM